jgi:hypothetical protein
MCIVCDVRCRTGWMVQSTGWSRTERKNNRNQMRNVQQVSKNRFNANLEQDAACKRSKRLKFVKRAGPPRLGGPERNTNTTRTETVKPNC